MSFFESLKRGLGFSGAEDDDNLYSDTAEPAAPVSHAQPAPPVADVKPPVFDADKQAIIFRSVVKIFNESMPAFVRQSVDQDRQARLLRDALDDGVKSYLNSLIDASQAYCESRWQQTRSAMSAELEAIKSKAGDIEKKSADFQQKQLSADRQRRALSDRVHDLEAQLVKLEAEREQYELENRSLVNRIKVAGVQQEDVDSARAEIESLKQEINRLKQNPGESQSAENDALKIQIDEMTNGIESLKEQLRVSNQLVEELRKNLAHSAKRIAERDEQIEANQAVMDQYHEELDKKMLEVDERLNRDADKIKALKQTVAERDQLIESLRRTIAENLRNQARREKELQDKLDALVPKMAPAEPEPQAPVDPDDPEIEVKAPLISEEDLSAIEKTFESEDWLSGTPSSPTASMRPQTDDNFGYQEPPRKHADRPDNPSQLSLF